MNAFVCLEAKKEGTKMKTREINCEWCGDKAVYSVSNPSGKRVCLCKDCYNKLEQDCFADDAPILTNVIRNGVI